MQIGEDNEGAIGSTLMNEFRSLKEKLKEEDGEYPHESPYANLEKAAVLQESRIFNDSSVVTQNPRKCSQMITKLLFLSVQGEHFSSMEITDVFFGVTKLFQSQDATLRRMMYLFIKEIAENCNPDDVIIVTSSLTKDMNLGEDLFRANSMRVLAKIIDGTMLGAIERYLKQAIIDKNPFVASSALMAGLHLFNSCPEIIRRWVNEVQEAVHSSNDMVQFHALSLLYKMRQNDRLAVQKIVQQLSRGTLRSPLAACMLIRYTCVLLEEDPHGPTATSSRGFLELCLRHKSEIVVFEAAKAMCSLPGADKNDVVQAVNVLQLFLSSSKPTRRYATMRVLSEIAGRHPLAVAKCNDDMEILVSDANRSIATLAITTLLKTGTESSVDRLLKQIGGFMSEIGDEFKVVIVTAIRDLCLKYPGKHRVMVSFLATFLREEGEFTFKRAIVDAIIELMDKIPDTKESSLLHLCEFIEDCEFSELIVQVMHVIAAVGPSSNSPSRFVRFVFNRMILENASVRAAAVSTLGVIACKVPALRQSLHVLITRSLVDENDEVRDRAVVALQAMDLASGDDAALKYLIDEPLPMPFASLERSLRALSAHVAQNPAALSETLSLANLPVVQEAAAPVASSSTTKRSTTKAPVADEADVVDPSADVYKLPEFAFLGRAFRASTAVLLTESEVEYVVSLVKHVFADYIVLQFKVRNTLDNQLLRNVTIKAELGDESLYRIEKVIPAAEAKYGSEASVFMLVKRLGEPVSCPVTGELHFTLFDVDTTGELLSDRGFDEDYPIEGFDLSTCDYMAPVPVSDFRRSWEQIGNTNEVREKFSLQFKRYEDAIAALVGLMGMAPVDGTGTVNADNTAAGKPHLLHLSGVFIGNVSVLMRAQLTLSGNSVVLMIAVRSSDPEISRMVADCIS